MMDDAEKERLAKEALCQDVSLEDLICTNLDTQDASRRQELTEGRKKQFERPVSPPLIAASSQLDLSLDDHIRTGGSSTGGSNGLRKKRFRDAQATSSRRDSSSFSEREDWPNPPPPPPEEGWPRGPSRFGLASKIRRPARMTPHTETVRERWAPPARIERRNNRDNFEEGNPLDADHTRLHPGDSGPATSNPQPGVTTIITDKVENHYHISMQMMPGDIANILKGLGLGGPSKTLQEVYARYGDKRPAPESWTDRSWRILTRERGRKAKAYNTGEELVATARRVFGGSSTTVPEPTEIYDVEGDGDGPPPTKAIKQKTVYEIEDVDDTRRHSDQMHDDEEPRVLGLRQSHPPTARTVDNVTSVDSEDDFPELGEARPATAAPVIVEVVDDPPPQRVAVTTLPALSSPTKKKSHRILVKPRDIANAQSQHELPFPVVTNENLAELNGARRLSSSARRQFSNRNRGCGARPTPREIIANIALQQRQLAQLAESPDCDEQGELGPFAKRGESIDSSNRKFADEAETAISALSGNIAESCASDQPESLADTTHLTLRQIILDRCRRKENSG